MPIPLIPRIVYHWESAHICGHFRPVQWDVLKSGTVSDAINNFVNHYIPSTVPVEARPTVWWNRFCQRT